MYYEQTLRLIDVVTAQKSEAEAQKTKNTILKNGASIKALSFNLEMMAFGKLQHNPEYLAQYENDAICAIQNINNLCDEYHVEHIYPNPPVNGETLIEISCDYWNGLGNHLAAEPPIQDWQDLPQQLQELGIQDMMLRISELGEDDPRAQERTRTIYAKLGDAFAKTDEDRKFIDFMIHNVGAFSKEHTYEAMLRECGICYD